MKIEANKFYRTSDGRKAYVAAMMEGAVPEECAVGWVLRDGGSWESCWWSAKGAFDVMSEFNIVSEWTEAPEVKPTEERWLYAYFHQVHGAWLSREQIAEDSLRENVIEPLGRIKLEPME